MEVPDSWPSRPDSWPSPPDRTLVAAAVAGIVLLLLAATAVGGLFALGPGTLGDGGDGPPPTPPPDNGSGPGEDHVRPFSIDIESIERCGETCRDVTVTLTNNGGKPRENVTVSTEMFAGNDSVWEGEASVGTLGSGESVTRTERVDVGLGGGMKIQRNGGTVLIVTVVEWNGGSATFRERRQVA